MKYLSFSLLILLFFSIKINAQENEEPVIEDSRLFKIYLNNSIIEYGEDEQPWVPEPEEIPDADGDGIRDEEDPDHPSNDEDSYASWRIFLNTFCNKSFNNDEEMYSLLNVNYIPTYDEDEEENESNNPYINCKGFAKMPTEDLQITSLGNWKLNGDNRFNQITGLSNVNSFENLDITGYNDDNLNMSPVNLSNLSGKTFQYLNIHNVTSSNLSGVTVTGYLTLLKSYISNINATLNEGCCTQLRASKVDNYTINSTGKLNGIYVMHSSHLGNLTVNGNKEIKYVILEDAWNNGEWFGVDSTLNNTNLLSGLNIDEIYLIGSTEIEMDLSGLSYFISKNRIEMLRVKSKDFDFGNLSSVNSIGYLELYSTKIDFNKLQHISTIETGTVNTYLDSDTFENISEGRNIQIIGKAPITSNFCKGLQNGNINFKIIYEYSIYSEPIDLTPSLSDMCE